MLIQTDASKITQEELDHLHRMTKIARVARINACARSRKAREHVRILREAAQRVIDNWDGGDLADSVRELSLILEATKEGS